MNPLHKSVLKINALKREQKNILDNIDILSSEIFEKYLLLDKKKKHLYKLLMFNYDNKKN